MKTCVLIPSFNEAKTIGGLVSKIKAQGLDVIVVDDGSSDNTSELATEAGAHVIRHRENRGKGAAFKSGFAFALREDYAAVITMDGDGQHSPDDIPHFINAAEASSSDIILGNRMFFPKNMPLLRRITNRTMSSLISLICRKHIPDSQCGFRLHKRRVLEKLTPRSDNYEIETEILIEAHQKGMRVSSIPIQSIYRKEVSNINPFIDTIRFLRYLFKIFFSFGRK